ncbi:MAG: hypothetical protein JHD02_03940 [Thermoleophilaceae bacterium]|nr:hypothetical protein [Thermoleophilaceae bacterium]
MKVTPTPGSLSGRRIDRVGDPLEGLVNLFDLALVLAVGLLLAALSSAGVVGLVAGPSGQGTPIPGQPTGGPTGGGQGTAVGQVYRLQDGSYVFVPSGAPNTGAGATGGGATGTTGSPTLGTGAVTPPTAGTGAVPTTPPAGGSPGGSSGF